MEFTEVTLWGLNKDKWVKRRSFEFNHELMWNRREFAKTYEEKYNMVHAFFPNGIIPNDFPIIFEMLQVTNKKLKGFFTDFYYHDCISFFKYEQNVLWSVRETGTYMFEVNGEHESESSKKVELQMYRYNEGCNISYYHVKDGVLKKITFEAGLKILENKPVTHEKFALGGVI